jgi:hypothetical protein
MPARKYVKPDEKVSLKFTAAERRTILNDVESLDDDYEHALQNTPADQALEFTLDDWDYLGGVIAEEAEVSDDPKRKQKLTSIFAMIEGLLAAYYTDEEPE